MGAEFEANITAVERVKEYFSIPQEPEWNKHDLFIPSTWPSAGKVVLNNFSVKYREESAFVLRNINAEILPGEKIGIVGRTGAGKSSLTLALFRLLENSIGDIIIDGINIKNIGLHDLRHKLTIIPQVNILNIQNNFILTKKFKLGSGHIFRHHSNESRSILEALGCRDLECSRALSFERVHNEFR